MSYTIKEAVLREHEEKIRRVAYESGLAEGRRLERRSKVYVLVYEPSDEVIGFVTTRKEADAWVLENKDRRCWYSVSRLAARSKRGRRKG